MMHVYIKKNVHIIIIGANFITAFNMSFSSMVHVSAYTLLQLRIMHAIWTTPYWSFEANI